MLDPIQEIRPITMDDYRIVETLSRSIEKAIAHGNYPLARKYIETGATLLDPTKTKTPNDRHVPRYDIDGVKEIQDKIWSILDALQSRPELTEFVEASLIVLRQRLFEKFLQGVYNGT